MCIGLLFMKIPVCAINNFYTFVSSDLGLWSLDLKFVLPVTCVQWHVSTKFEVSMSFWLQLNRRHRTDRQTRTSCPVGRTDRRGATRGAYFYRGPRKKNIYEYEFLIDLLYSWSVQNSNGTLWSYRGVQWRILNVFAPFAPPFNYAPGGVAKWK